MCRIIERNLQVLITILLLLWNIPSSSSFHSCLDIFNNFCPDLFSEPTWHLIECIKDISALCPLRKLSSKKKNLYRHKILCKNTLFASFIFKHSKIGKYICNIRGIVEFSCINIIILLLKLFWELMSWGNTHKYKRHNIKWSVRCNANVHMHTKYWK